MAQVTLVIRPISASLRAGWGTAVPSEMRRPLSRSTRHDDTSSPSANRPPGAACPALCDPHAHLRHRGRERHGGGVLIDTALGAGWCSTTPTPRTRSGNCFATMCTWADPTESMSPGNRIRAGTVHSPGYCAATSASSATGRGNRQQSISPHDPSAISVCSTEAPSPAARRRTWRLSIRPPSGPRDLPRPRYLCHRYRRRRRRRCTGPDKRKTDRPVARAFLYDHIEDLVAKGFRLCRAPPNSPELAPTTFELDRIVSLDLSRASRRHAFGVTP